VAPIQYRNYALASYDRTHNLQICGNYSLPFGKGKSMLNHPTEQREILAREFVQAAEAVYQAKGKMDEAAKSKQDVAPFKISLADRRIFERKAVAALERHRKEHGC
jgi:hypothetical protein